MTNPSETKLVERLEAGEACAEMGQRCRVMNAESGCICAEAATALASLADELRLAREEQIALLRFIQKEHPVTPEMWNALFPKEPL